MKLLLKIALSVLVLLFFVLQLYLKGSKERVEVGADDKGVKIQVIAKVEKEDDFQLFYRLQNQESFTEEKSIIEDVPASSDYQVINYAIADTSALQQLRLDLGQNIDQSPVSIKSISISSAGDHYLFSGKDVFKFFSPNMCLTLSNDSTFLNTITVEGHYDPYLVSIDNILGSEEAKNNLVEPSQTAAEVFSNLLVWSMVGVGALLGVVYLHGLLPSFLYSFLFILALVSPLLGIFWNVNEKYERLEKRELTKFPEFDTENLKEYPAKFEAYFDDNFGFRTVFVNWGSIIKSKIFKSSIKPDKVVHGQDDWLFLSGTFDRILDDYSRRNLYSSENLVNNVSSWEDHQKQLQKINGKYYKVFWPNKHTIYSEKLPVFIRIQQLDTLSRPDQVFKYLKENNSTLKFLDVRPELLNAKAHTQLYLKHDTHWNDYGAFLAYQKLMTLISEDVPGIMSRSISEYDTAWVEITGGDLTSMLGVHSNQDYKDKRPVFTYKGRDSIELISPVGVTEIMKYHNHTSQNDLTLLVFRDSFTSPMIQFINPHFKNVVYVWKIYDQQIVDEIKPDVVIDGFVERWFQ